MRAANDLDLEARLREARTHVLVLYAAGTKLPHWFELGVRDKVSLPDEPREALVGFGKHDFYWEVFDPYQEAPLVGGALSDDPGDIARDLALGMAYWDAGFSDQAVWEWSFHFDAHWGDHAVDALRALHRACNPTR